VIALDQKEELHNSTTVVVNGGRYQIREDGPIGVPRYGPIEGNQDTQALLTME
jgi:hypothetical protein